MTKAEILKAIEELELQPCPECGGAGLLDEECGNSYAVTCLECGTHSVTIDFFNDEQRLDAAKRAADLWNWGKAISSARGE